MHIHGSTEQKLQTFHWPCVLWEDQSNYESADDGQFWIVHDADVLPKFVDLIMEGLHKVTQHWSNCWCFSLCWASGMLVSDPNPCRPVLIERLLARESLCICMHVWKTVCCAFSSSSPGDAVSPGPLHFTFSCQVPLHSMKEVLSQL